MQFDTQDKVVKPSMAPGSTTLPHHSILETSSFPPLVSVLFSFPNQAGDAQGVPARVLWLSIQPVSLAV